MKDFMISAWPFIIMGILVIIAAVRANANVRKDGSATKNNYMIEGMAAGFVLGMVVSMLLDYSTGMGTCMGMLAGVAAGVYIPKKEKETDEDDQKE